MKRKNRRGRPRDPGKRVYSPVDGSELPYARLDAQGNIFFSWKDEKGTWHKRNLGRDKTAFYPKYLRLETQLVKGEKYVEIDSQDLQQGTKIINYPDGEVLPEEGESTESVLRRIEESNKMMFKRFQEGPEDLNQEVVEDKKLVPLSYIWTVARGLIHSNPKRASEMLGIPYENLVGLKKVRVYTLEEIGEYYFNLERFKNLTRRTQKKEFAALQRTWERFKRVLGVETVNEVKKEHVNKYYNDIMGEARKKDWAASTIHSFFEFPKRILNTAVVDLDDSQYIAEVRNKCIGKLRSPPKKVKKKAYKIKREEFQKLLKVSTTEEKAMWMLSLNAAYISVDLGEVPLSAFNWEKKTLVFPRGKREKEGEGKRACILWDETIRAIKDYQRDYPHDGKTLFLNRGKEVPYVSDRIRKKFQGVRDAANLRHITHKNFRQSFRTICAPIGHIQMSADAVLGHKFGGNRDEYIDPEEHPNIARDACIAVHDFYFGREKRE